MSMYYNPQLVKLLMEERIREARQSYIGLCCAEPKAEEPRTSLFSFLRRRQSPAACTC